MLRIVFWIFVLLLDAAVFFALTLMSMNFEDVYNSDFGAFLQAKELSPLDKAYPFFLIFWYVLHIFIGARLLFQRIRNQLR